MKALFRLYATPMTLVTLRVAGALAAFGVSLLMARHMEQAEMGRAMVLMSTAVLGGIFVTLGVEAGAVRYTALYRKDETPHLARGFFRFVWRVLAVLAPVLCICAIIALWMRAVILDAPFDAALAIAFLTACVMGVTRIGAAKAMAFGKVVRSLAPATFLRQIFLLSVFAIYVWQVGQPSALTVIWIFLLSNIIATIIQLLWNRGIAADIAGEGDDTSAWPVWMRYGGAMLPTLLFVQYSRDLTLIFASWGLPVKEIAILGVATAIVNFVKFGVSAINMSIAPKMADLIVKDDHAALRRLADVSNHMKIWPTLACFALLFMFGDDALRIFGEEFSDGHAILLILMLEPLALAFFGPAGQYLGFAGQQKVLMYAALVALVTMMVLIGVAARMAGLPGAAWAVAICWIGWSGGLAYLVRRNAGFGLTFADTIVNSVKGRP